MNHEEHDDLWQLLGKAKEPSVSPFFSRNVLRELHAQPQEKRGVSAWLFRRWQFASLGAAAMVLAGVGAWNHLDQRDSIAELAQEVSTSPDYAVISHLDELLAYEENSVWLDTPGY